MSKYFQYELFSVFSQFSQWEYTSNSSKKYTPQMRCAYTQSRFFSRWCSNPFNRSWTSLTVAYHFFLEKITSFLFWTPTAWNSTFEANPSLFSWRYRWESVFLTVFTLLLMASYSTPSFEVVFNDIANKKAVRFSSQCAFSFILTDDSKVGAHAWWEIQTTHCERSQYFRLLTAQRFLK